MPMPCSIALNDELAEHVCHHRGRSVWRRPACVLFVGIDGAGKTTTVGKLAKEGADAGRKVILGSADTFRAAAIEQLEEWARRAERCHRSTRERGSRPGKRVLRHHRSAPRPMAADLVLIDTAGRLHTSDDLMRELRKVVNVVRKRSKAARATPCS